MQLKTLSLIATIFLSGCCTPTLVHEVVPLPLLPIPELPKLSGEQQEAIDEDTFLILVERDTIQREHIRSINEQIKIHNEPP